MGAWPIGVGSPARSSSTPARQIVLQDAVDAIADAAARLRRLDEQLLAIVPSWSMAPVVAASQAMRGVSFIVAVTFVAEIGDVRRFDKPRRPMAFLGLLPSARSTGERVRPAGLTLAANRRARRVLVEGAWHRHRRTWLPHGEGAAAVIKLGDVVMILDLQRQGLSVSAIARELGIDRKTVRKYIARGLEPPVYGPRQARSRLIDPYVAYLRERVTGYPGLSGRRLLREIRERGDRGGYTAVTETVRDLRPPPQAGYEVRFETPPGDQAQVDFAHFETVFSDEPGVVRKVWLFSLILGYSRLIWARFVQHQDLQTVLRCHRAAFTTLGGVPRTILYDRMKTVVTGEPEPGHIVYNRHLVDFAAHHGYQPRACRPYRAKTKGKVERPYRYVRQDFFLARTFRNLEDLNAQLARWLD